MQSYPLKSFGGWRLTERYRVDLARQYLMGIGNGGFMALRLACDVPDLFAAVASFGGASAVSARECAASSRHATHVLAIHAVGDEFVKYDGAVNFNSVPYPGARRTTDIMALAQGCQTHHGIESAAKISEFYLPTPYNLLAGLTYNTFSLPLILQFMVETMHFCNCLCQMPH